MGWGNPVVGGTVLTVAAIESPNYDPVAGTGWIINQDGSATFHDISLPGFKAGVKVTFASVAPANPSTGDVWYDIGNGLLAKQWSGSAWVAYQISSGAIAPGGIDPSNIAKLTASLIGNLGVLNANPFYTGGDAAGWAGFDGSFTVTDTPPAGAPYKYAGQFTATAANGSMQEKGGSFPVTVDTQYLVTGWVNSTTGKCNLGINWSLNGGYVSTSSAIITVPANQWTQVSKVFTSPSSGVNGGYEWTGPAVSGGTIYGQALTTLPQVPGSLIQAGTVDTAQLAAGIVYAGIIDGTIVNAATFNGSVFNGTNWVENSLGMFLYNGTPGTGNLLASIAPTSGSDDGHGNAFKSGITAYSTSTPGSYVQISQGNVFIFNGANDAVLGADANGILTIGSAKAISATMPFTQSIAAVQPGTTTTPEGFHNPPALLNGWVNGSNVRFAYRYLVGVPDTVEIIGSIDGAARTSATFFQLPAGYHPLTPQFGTALCTTLSYSGQVGIGLDTSGNLTVQATTTTNAYDFHCFFNLIAT